MVSNPKNSFIETCRRAKPIHAICICFRLFLSVTNLLPIFFFRLFRYTVKSENGMDRNHLKGKKGDRVNAILAGCGFKKGRSLPIDHEVSGQSFAKKRISTKIGQIIF